LLALDGGDITSTSTFWGDLLGEKPKDVRGEYGTTAARREKTFLSPQLVDRPSWEEGWVPVPSPFDCMVSPRELHAMLSTRRGDLGIFSTQKFPITGIRSGLILRAGFISARGSMPPEKLRGARLKGEPVT
jgi:hypothetical protein